MSKDLCTTEGQNSKVDLQFRRHIFRRNKFQVEQLWRMQMASQHPMLKGAQIASSVMMVILLPAERVETPSVRELIN
jgi:hypothetical protein